MKNDIKQELYKGATKGESTNVELLKYQLNASKRESRKNLVIASLITAILAFATGYILNDMSKGEVKALQSTNYSLRLENEQLKAQAQSENQ